MRLHVNLPIGLAVTLGALLAAARPAAAQDAIIADPDFVNSQRLSAEVSSTGDLGVNTGAISASQLATGLYEVIFLRNVRDCAYVATMADHDLNTLLGKASVTGLNSDPNGVLVATFSNFGATVNRNFHLRIACPS
jgi:hypothetical protein